MARCTVCGQRLGFLYGNRVMQKRTMALEVINELHEMDGALDMLSLGESSISELRAQIADCLNVGASLIEMQHQYAHGGERPFKEGDDLRWFATANALVQSATALIVDAARQHGETKNAPEEVVGQPSPVATEDPFTVVRRAVTFAQSVLATVEDETIADRISEILASATELSEALETLDGEAADVVMSAVRGALGLTFAVQGVLQSQPRFQADGSVQEVTPQSQEEAVTLYLEQLIEVISRGNAYVNAVPDSEAFGSPSALASNSSDVSAEEELAAAARRAQAEASDPRGASLVGPYGDCDFIGALDADFLCLFACNEGPEQVPWTISVVLLEAEDGYLVGTRSMGPFTEEGAIHAWISNDFPATDIGDVLEEVFVRNGSAELPLARGLPEWVVYSENWDGVEGVPPCLMPIDDARRCFFHLHRKFGAGASDFETWFQWVTHPDVASGRVSEISDEVRSASEAAQETFSTEEGKQRFIDYLQDLEKFDGDDGP